MSLWAEGAFQTFVENPLAATGTDWKIRQLNSAWRRLVSSDEWREQGIIRTYGSEHTARILQQIDVSVEEQDGYISQEALLADKSEKQGDAIVALLRGIDESTSGVLPGWMTEVFSIFSSGSIAFSWLTTDVAAREIFVDRRVIPKKDDEPSKWEKRENYYAPPWLWSEHKWEKLQTHILQYWEEKYGDNRAGIGAVRALDSSLALNHMKLSWGKGFEMGTLPGISTVGVLFEEHPLATHKGRLAMLDLIWEKHRRDDRIVERRWSPLTALSGRAGGVQTEVLVELARNRGINARVLATGTTEQEKMEDLIQSAEGAPYKLFAALMLAAAKGNRLLYTPEEAPHCKSLRIYPSKDRREQYMLMVHARTIQS